MDISTLVGVVVGGVIVGVIAVLIGPWAQRHGRADARQSEREALSPLGMAPASARRSFGDYDARSGVPGEFVVVRLRRAVVMMTIIWPCLAGLVVALGLTQRGAWPNNIVPDVITTVGIGLVGVAAVYVFTLWRWRLVVTEQGLELRSGVWSTRSLGFGDIRAIAFTQPFPDRLLSVSIWGSDVKPFVEVASIYVGYAWLCDRLRAARPDLMRKAHTAGD